VNLEKARAAPTSSASGLGKTEMKHRRRTWEDYIIKMEFLSILEALVFERNGHSITKIFIIMQIFEHL